MLIKNMIEDLGNPGEEPIPIMNVRLIRPYVRPTKLAHMSFHS